MKTFTAEGVVNCLTQVLPSRPTYIRFGKSLYELREIKDRVTDCVEFVAGGEIAQLDESRIIWKAGEAS